MKRFLPILAVILLSIPAILPLFQPNFYSTHDGVTHVVRFLRFDEALRDGQIPPRWAKTIAFNLGSPVLMYNAPLPYLAAEIPHSLGINFSFSIKIIFAFALVLSCLTMFLFLNDVFGPLGAFLGSLIYIWAPYRFIDLYVRGAYPEHFALIFPPLLLLSAKKIIEKSDLKWFFCAIFSISGLILSHNVMFVLFGGVYLLYGLVLFLKIRNKNGLVLILLSLIFSFALTSSYIGPAYFEKQYSNLDKLIENSSYKENLVPLSKVIYSKWGWGSLQSDSPMSPQLGITQWLIVLWSVVVFITAKVYQNKKSIHKIYFYLFLPLVLISLFLMTPYSSFFWDKITLLDFFLYPWRFLTLATFGCAILSAFVIFYLPSRFQKFFVVIFLSLGIFANRHNLQLVGTVPGNDTYYLNYFDPSDIWGEFLPKGANLDNVYRCKIEKCFYSNKVASSSAYQKIEAPPGVVINNIVEKSQKLTFSYSSNENFIGKINTYDFPGWNIYVDNKLTGHAINNIGTMDVNFLSGEHNVEVRFEDTALRKWSNYISIITLVSFILFILKKRFVRNE